MNRFCKRIPARGAAAGILTALALLGGMALPGHAQLSPGPLSAAHSDLDSILQCTSCHSFGIGRASFRCTDCHTEIRDRVARETGYHAEIVEPGTGNESCAGCHAEHFGREFQILVWPGEKEAFDHREAGYVLQGGHASIGCDDCHRADHVAPGNRDGILLDLDQTMLGLDARCLSCHEDEHRGQLQDDCAGCHSFDRWNETPGFAHEETRFPLTGLHSPVACDQCHSSDAGGPTRFSPIAFGDCTDCHRDPHSDVFGPQCDTCHSTAGWHALAPSFSFDHEGTRFPLDGGHREPACDACHKDRDFAIPVAHERCLDCHADDHRGQFESRADGGDCEGCHDVVSFEMSTFGPGRHDETAYPLVGMHREVGCESCHEPAAEGTDYHPPSGRCLDCHTDSHEGQFAESDEGECEGCHKVDGFRPSTYTLRQHQTSGFPLASAHQAVPCMGCHTPLSQAPDAGLAFRIADTSCRGCHLDPHPRTPAADSDAPASCDGCHTVEAWGRISGFDHRTTAFELLGAHRVAACESCHLPAEGPAGSIIGFDRAAETCAGCHEDIHRGQFQGQFAQGRYFEDPAGETTDCTACHDSATWLDVRFDHERDASFALAGAHDSVACGLCHLEEASQGGDRVRIFAGTPTECASCH